LASYARTEEYWVQAVELDGERDETKRWSKHEKPENNPTVHTEIASKGQ